MASNKISVTDLEFDSIKSNLKTYLKSQTTFIFKFLARKGKFPI